MVEIESVDRKAHLRTELEVLFLLGCLRVHPFLQLRFADDSVAVKLISAADERVEGLFGVLLQKVRPYWVVT